MKATKKLIGASVALVAALAVSVGSTFAWFTTSNTAKVKQIEATVTTSDTDLLMAYVRIPTDGYDGLTWTHTVDASAASAGKELKALTSKTNTGATETALDLVDKDNQAPNTNDYIEFTIAIKSTKELKIVLTSDSAVSGTDSAEAKSTIDPKAWSGFNATDYGIEGSIAENTAFSTKTNAANAARVGFYTLAAEEFNTKTGVGVWCPNEAENSGKEATGDNTTTHGKGFWKGNLASDYAQRVGAATEAVEAKEYQPVVAVETRSLSYSTLAKGENGLIATLAEHDVDSESYYCAMVTIRLWIEGTDGDCLNSIFGDTIKLDLSFFGVENDA